jgi:uncharacterized protein YbjQ (UPF0145 family)
VTTPFATTHVVPRLAPIAPVRAVSSTYVVQLTVQPLPANVLTSPGGLRELPVWDDAVAGGRRTVIERLDDEAARVGGDGVVGVRIVEREPPWLDFGLELRASGTAVCGLDALTNLSEADVRVLLEAGATVAGLVHAAAVVAVLPGEQTRDRYRYGGGAHNFEMPDMTDAVTTLRKRLVASLATQARELGADGIVALDSSVSPRWDHGRRRAFNESLVILDCRAIATAIRDDGRAPRSRPVLALDLRRNG